MKLFTVSISFFCFYFLQAGEAKAHCVYRNAKQSMAQASPSVAGHCSTPSNCHKKGFSVAIKHKESPQFLQLPGLVVLQKNKSHFTAKNFYIRTGLSPPFLLS
jgi:hypothetical protein